MMILFWLACRTPACETPADCAFGEACTLGACVGRSCATSAQCGMESYCTDDGQCVAGCATDGDCLAGSSCDAGVCVETACVDTHLDCGFREHCTDGACVDAGEPHCAPCTTDDQCGAGNLCWVDQWCAVDCADGGACPGGFQCTTVDDGEGGARQVCITSCWMYSGRG